MSKILRQDSTPSQAAPSNAYTCDIIYYSMGCICSRMKFAAKRSEHEDAPPAVAAATPPPPPLPPPPPVTSPRPQEVNDDDYYAV